MNRAQKTNNHHDRGAIDKNRTAVHCAEIREIPDLLFGSVFVLYKKAEKSRKSKKKKEESLCG
jgi:hypothetical protein